MIKEFKRLPGNFKPGFVYIAANFNKEIEGIGFYETKSTKRLEGHEVMLGEQTAAIIRENGSVVVLTNHEQVVKTFKAPKISQAFKGWLKGEDWLASLKNDLLDLQSYLNQKEELLERNERGVSLLSAVKNADELDLKFFGLENVENLLSVCSVTEVRVDLFNNGSYSIYPSSKIPEQIQDIAGYVLDDFEYSRDRQIRDIKRLKERIEKKESEINSFELRKSKPAKQVVKQIESLEGVSSVSFKDDLMLVYTDDIILSHPIEEVENCSSLADKKYNMGQFVIHYNFVEGRVSVKKHKNNQTVRGIYHPHLSDRGPICFGNMQDISRDAHRNKDAAKFIQACLFVLMNYHHSNPYRYLQQFRSISQPPNE